MKVKVIAGESLGVASPVKTRTPAYYLDVTLRPGGSLSQPIPENWNAFAYVLKGTLTSPAEDGTNTQIEPHHTVVFDTKGDSILVKNDAESTGDTHLVIIAGKPIGEPIVQHGPFVMCTDEEIYEAMSDFRSGRNGFEGAAQWRSDLGQSLRA